jgi:outer membrane protein assembly factor BamB
MNARLTTGLLFALVATPIVIAADWSMFRGTPAQTGVATSALPDRLEVLWKFQAKDAFEGTAAIVGETVYVGCMDKYLYALNRTDGSIRWKYQADDAIKASPAVRDGLVYFGDFRGTFHCVDALEGTRVWVFRTDGEVLSSANFEGDKVLFGSSDEHLYCLNAKTGALLQPSPAHLALQGPGSAILASAGPLAALTQVVAAAGVARSEVIAVPVWKFKTQGAIQCTPAIIDGKIFITGCDPNLRIITIADGKEFASIELDAQGEASPALVGDILYVGNASKNTVLAVDWRKPRTVWEYQPERPFPFYASAAVKDNLVLVGGRDKNVHALDTARGELKWTFPARGKVDSSAVIVGERVFIGSSDGNLYALDLRKGTKLWNYALGSPVMASPAVGQNCLVIGTEDGVLYCFGAK